MSTLTAALDLKHYGKLLAKAAPKVIKTEAENERMLAIVEDLMAKGEDKLSAEEEALLELLAGLIHDYELSAFASESSAPHEILQFLIDQRGMTHADLVPHLGTRQAASAILAGQREISREQAQRLAVAFRVRPELFR